LGAAATIATTLALGTLLSSASVAAAPNQPPNANSAELDPAASSRPRPLEATPSPAPVWGEVTASRHAAPGESGPLDQPLLSLCASSDRGLSAVAARLAAGGLDAPGLESLDFALRVAGSPYVWPRAWRLRGPAIDPGDARARLKRWLASLEGGGPICCGIGRAHDRQGNDVVAVVAVIAEADLAPVPVRTRVGTWISVEAKVLVPAEGAKVVILGPSGPPQSLLTSFTAAEVQARFHADRPGDWAVQVLIDGPHGPRPVLEATIFAGVPPTTAPRSAPRAKKPRRRALIQPLRSPR
jgi:hypothetical protein